MRVPVFVDDWQLQCCGEHFRIGSTVAWKLEEDQDDFLVDALGELAPQWSANLPLVRVIERRDDGSDVLVVGASGLSVQVSRERAEGDLADLAESSSSVRTTGPLREEHHSDGRDHLPPTTGAVRRIRAQWQGYAPSPDPMTHGQFPRPVDAVLVDVSSTQHVTSDDAFGRKFLGWLVDLEVVPAPSRPSTAGPTRSETRAAP